MTDETKKFAGRTMDEIHRRWYSLRDRGEDFAEYAKLAGELAEAVTHEEVVAIHHRVQSIPFLENVQLIFDYYNDLERFVLLRFLRRLLESSGEEFDFHRLILGKAKQLVCSPDEQTIGRIKALKKEFDDGTK